MQTRALKTLVTVSEVGSFADAAKRLNMTLSTVSMQMKALERDLDVALFDRAHRPPALTAKGHEVAEHARTIVAAERDLLKACQPDGSLRGTFHVGFVQSASVRLLPHFLKQAAKQLPDARFEVETGLSEHLERKVLERKLDLAVLTSSGKQADTLTYTTLQTEPLVYAMPTALKDRPEDWLLRNRPFLHFSPTTGIGRLISTHLDRGRQKPERVIVLDGMEAIVACIEADIGFTILPEVDVMRYANRHVSIRPVGTTTLSRDLALVARSTHFTARHLQQIGRLFD